MSSTLRLSKTTSYDLILKGDILRLSALPEIWGDVSVLTVLVVPKTKLGFIGSTGYDILLLYYIKGGAFFNTLNSNLPALEQYNITNFNISSIY